MPEVFFNGKLYLNRQSNLPKVRKVMSVQDDYWEECIANAAEECDLALTEEQLKYLADSAKNGHEYYGMAFYSPPDSDRIGDIEKEYNLKLKSIQREFEDYQRNAETAVKRALREHSDSNVSIGQYGDVFRHNGRTEQIL